MKREKTINTIKSILKKNGAIKISLFGSFSRNEEKQCSDIDILVKFNRNMGYFEFIKIENELSENIGRRVDLVTEEAINPFMIDSIKKDEMLLYETK